MELDNKKKTEKVLLRTTEHLKSKLSKLADKDGISQNSVLNQALSWYVNERAKHAAY